MKSLETHHKNTRYKLYQLPIVPYFLITDTFRKFKGKKYLNALGTLFIAVILSGIWLGGYTLTALAGYQIVKQAVFEKTENKPVVTTLSPTPVDCVINGIKTTAISKEKCDEWKDFSPSTATQIPNKSNAIRPTVDPDPIITCNINANCGGGSRQMKSSECSNTICCQIDGKWYFYLAKDKCTQDQQANLIDCIIGSKTFRISSKSCNDIKNQYGIDDNYIPPTYVPSVITFTPVPIPTIDPAAEQQRLADIQRCKDSAKSKYDYEAMILRNQYRAAGALSSSDYGLASQKLQSDYQYWLYLCDHAY